MYLLTKPKLQLLLFNMQIIIHRQNKKQTFVITTQQPLNQNHYYKSYQVIHKKSKQPYLLVKLIGLARANITPFDIFQNIILSSCTITKQFTDYMKYCFKAVIQAKKQKNFVDYFLGKQNKGKIILYDQQKLSLSQYIQAWSKSFNEQVKLKNKKIMAKEMTYQWLSDELKKNINKQIFQYYTNKSKKILYNISITPVQQKRKKIQQICHQISSPQCQIEYYLSSDNQFTYILLNPKSNKNSSTIVKITVADLINKKLKFNFKMSQDDLQKIAFEMFKTIYKYRQNYKNNHKNLSFKLDQKYLSYYLVNPHNVFLNLIKKEGQNFYTLYDQNPCQLDYIYPILQELGLSYNTTTIQQKMIMSSSLHPILEEDDLEAAISKEWGNNPVLPSQLMQCYALIHWICLIDYMSIKLTGQYDEDHKSMLDMKKGEHIIKMINSHSQYLTNLPSLLLTTYRMQNCQYKTSLITQLKYQSFHHMFQQLLALKEDIPPATKFYKVELFIKFKELIFSQREGLKSFFEKSNVLTHLQMEQRYFIIYLICKWAIFSTYKEILEYKGTKIRQIKKFIRQNKHISQVIGQSLAIFENIITRIQKKSQQKKTSKTSLSKKIQPQKNITLQNIYQKSQSQQKSHNILNQQIGILKEKIYSQCKKIHQQIFKNIQQIEIYRSYKKILSFLVMFLEVDGDKYAEFCSIYDKIINNKDLTAEKAMKNEDIDKFYLQSQEKLEACFPQGSVLFWKNAAPK